MRPRPSPIEPAPNAKPRAAADVQAEAPADAVHAGLHSRFGRALSAFVLPSRFAIAVSGGGDSIALMHLVARIVAKRRVKPTVLTVDHGLRPESAAQAKKVAAWAADAGLPAVILTWKGDLPEGSLEDGARIARYTLLGQWCTKNNAGALLLAHTREDQAETFLLRLARGSGVDGLSAMRPRAPFPFGAGPLLLRPLLGFPRAELRAYLRALKAPWLEDPMNADPRFARTKMRALLPQLEEAGLSLDRIAQAADHLSRARIALEEQTGAVTAKAVSFDPKGEALIDARALIGAPREIGLRVLAATLAQVSASTTGAKKGTPYRPRFERLERLFDSIAGTGFKGATLAGCNIAPAPRRDQAFGPDTLRVSREGPRKTPPNPSTKKGKRRTPEKGRNLRLPSNS